VAVKIRLARIGAKGQPSYRVVVADERVSRNGRNIEIIGHYDPLKEPTGFVVNKEKVLDWIKKGAQPSFTVRKLLAKAGIIKAIDFSKLKKKASKQKGAEKAAAPVSPAAPAK
jgi:small subunit ribosomal protein S16